MTDAGRIKRLQTAIPTGCDAALVLTPQNRYYLSGFRSSDGALVITRNKAWLFADGRYFEAAQKTAIGCEVVLMKSFSSQLSELLTQERVQTLCLEDDVSVSMAGKIAEYADGVRVYPDKRLGNIIRDMRAKKDSFEIDCIKSAQKITDAAFDFACGYIKPGITERDLALEIEFFMRKNGAERVSFDLITVSGKNTSLPHGVPTDKVIENGDFVTMDIGCVVNGYCSDMTRTVALGHVTPEQEEIYSIVLEAQKSAIAAVKAGVIAGSVDKAARDIIKNAGYGEYFGHSTGHSLGIDIHETPTFSPFCYTPLEENMIITVEPGIYLPGKFGVRIEDMVLVTADGCENLTHSP